MVLYTMHTALNVWLYLTLFQCDVFVLHLNWIHKKMITAQVHVLKGTTKSPLVSKSQENKGNKIHPIVNTIHTKVVQYNK